MTYLQLTLCLFWLLLAIGCDDGTRQTKQNQHALGSIEQHDTMDRLVSDFMEVPLEGINEDGDSCAYRHACETAEMIVGEIWRLTRDPDKVIDFWTIQRKRFETEAERCESAFRRAMARGRGLTGDDDESRRFHNLRCLYLDPIEIRDEHILMEVVSNKFFSVDRSEFDKSMEHLRKVLGKNFGYDEQLRLLHPNKK